MDLLGYVDRFSAHPGERLQFKVSARMPTYDAAIVRLQHGDLNPAGPGLKMDLVRTAVDGRYRGREQPIRAGSSVEVPDHPALRMESGFSIVCWIWPTTPVKRPNDLMKAFFTIDPWTHPPTLRPSSQGLLEKLGSWSFLIGESGDLVLKVGTASVETGKVLQAGAWHFVAATFDVTRQKVTLHQQATVPVALHGTNAQVTATMEVRPSASCGPLLFGRAYNGKIDNPRLFARALSADELAMLAGGAPADDFAGLVADWDFARDFASDRISDRGPHRLHGRAVNMPARAVTGHNWTGRETCFRNAPAEYGAIHFHDDDLEDARWETDFELRVPDDLPSGVYAARLTAGDTFDYVPFFVRPPRGRATAPALFLVPTLSYLAYANDHMPAQPLKLARLGTTLEEFLARATPYERDAFRYILDNQLLSQYDRHSDGSGTVYSTRLRPILNMRPCYNKPGLLFTAPHQFNMDLYLVDWLVETGRRFDVATDEDLHFEGTSLLERYRVVLTGTHPEYWSRPMLDAMERYLAEGGRLMYLGGNGFYWVTSLDPERPHVIEVRRGEAGIRLWQAEPGEYYHSTTGELGGLWRYRGRAPQRMVGVGFTAAGGDRAAPYRRLPDSFEPRAEFIFEGVGREEVLGDFGIHMGGAAGWELDRYDLALGTPPHALRLATSFGHTNTYQYAVEEVWKASPNLGGASHTLVRADLTFFECLNGGAVFSTGSISWCGSLSHQAYQNNVSRITGNVLTAFSGAALPLASACHSDPCAPTTPRANLEG